MHIAHALVRACTGGCKWHWSIFGLAHCTKWQNGCEQSHTNRDRIIEPCWHIATESSDHPSDFTSCARAALRTMKDVFSMVERWTNKTLDLNGKLMKCRSFYQQMASKSIVYTFRFDSTLLSVAVLLCPIVYSISFKLQITLFLWTISLLTHQFARYANYALQKIDSVISTRVECRSFIVSKTDTAREPTASIGSENAAAKIS